MATGKGKVSMAATLIVGLGGMGLKVVRIIAERAEAEGLADVEFVVMDTDVNDLRAIKAENPRIYTVQTSPTGTVGAALDQNQHARDQWFPLNDGLTGKPFTEGAGQVRAVSRLAFDHAVSQGAMSELEKAIEKLHGISGETMRQEMRIIITGSICGGTGSGLVLPAAMYIRNYLIMRYQDNSAIIRGFFLEPDVIFDVITDEEERNSLRCNAYATLRELDAFFRKEYSGDSDELKHVVFNAPQPGLGERVDYPNILPYHFVFLMDAINNEGEHLPSYNAYLEHAAESIYGQALSALSSRSNSSEDNVIRKLAANNGRSRYCGAGSAYLEYPVKEVQRYLGLKWARSNISQEWLEIDDEYVERRREDDTLLLRDHYLRTFGSKMKIVPFYKKISRNVVRVLEPEAGGVPVTIEPAREYAESVIEHADAVNEAELLRYCGGLARVLNSQGLRPVPSTPEAIDDVAQDNGAAAVGVLQNRYDSFFNSACSYNQIVTEEVEDMVRGLAGSAFAISDYNDDPLTSNSAEWQIESIVRIANGGRTGAMHPGAVRYMLYTASSELERCISDCLSDVDTCANQIRSIQRTMGVEETKGEENKERSRGLSLPFLNKNVIDEETVGKLLETADQLKKLRNAIDKRRQALVRKAYLQAAKEYVDALSGAYEAFYSYLGGQIAGIDADLKSLEFNSRFNASKGETHKYVCASTRCLRAIDSECPVKGDSGDLPPDLCGDIYRSLLRYAKIARQNDKAARSNDIKSQLFDRLFDATVIDYWVERVLDPQMGYPQKVDKSVIQAAADEALYTSEESFLDDEQRIRYVESYLMNMLEQAHHLAAPFIEPPVGEFPRTFKTCAYSEDILKGVGPYYDALRRKLGELNGTELKSRNFSKYGIMFYRSVYGFCATNLPKYAPERLGLQNMPEGEYHRAYFILVNQLSPNLKENRLITPHIDKNWHLVDCLPDLNEENELRIKREIVLAFVHGLIFQEFDAEQVSSGDDVFYLKGTATHPRTNLWVSNGTPCDRFYEVFDALKFNPCVVSMLVDRSEKRMIDEKNNSVGLSVKDCRLVRSVRSRAFAGNLDGSFGIESVVPLINALGRQRAQGGLPSSGLPKGLSSELVTNMFGIGSMEADNRRSILEIPLYYRISLPHSETRTGEIESMIEGLFAAIREHLENFCEEFDLEDACGRFFEEQYLLFERNLVEVEKMVPGIYGNRVVNAIREKTLSFVEPVPSRHERVSVTQNQIKSAWRNYRD